MIEQEKLDHLRAGAQLGKGMKLSDVTNAPDEQVLGLYLMMSESVLMLVDEVERLNHGLALGRAEIERHRKLGEDSVKDPSLSWYETDHYHEERVAVERAMDDVLEELDKGLEEK